MNALGKATYNPAIFNVSDINAAKRIILTTEGQLSTDERWRIETPYLVDLISQQTSINEKSIVLDYGCGIGRMSKALIERHGCKVVGVDISPSMRALAAIYVNDERFLTCAPAALEWMWPFVGFDVAIAIWVLQHCHEVEKDLDTIQRKMRNGAELFIVNDYQRLVPTDRGWVNDGKSVAELAGERFNKIDSGYLDKNLVGNVVSAVSYWATWRK